MIGGSETVILSAVFAGAVAVGVTAAIERWGGIAGGLLGTLPTTIVPAALGIHAQSASTEAFQAALVATPWGLLANAAFLLTWRVVPRRLPPTWPLSARLALMAALSLAVWTLLALVLTAALRGLLARGVPPLTLGALATVALAGVGVGAANRRVPAPSGRRRVRPLVLASRGLLAGAAIGVSVLLAASGDPVLAGLAAVFPAIFLTTMISLWLAQGEAVPAGAVGPMVLGSTSVAVFSTLAAGTMPAWGAIPGASGAWVLSALVVTAPAGFWLWRRGDGSP